MKLAAFMATHWVADDREIVVWYVEVYVGLCELVAFIVIYVGS